MILQQLLLHNFRSYTNFSCTFDPQFTCIIGPNAHGKTNLLEAIHFASSGHGFNEDKKEELIRVGEQDMSVTALCTHGSDALEYKVGIHIAENQTGVKSFFVNRSRKTLHTYGKDAFPVVLFSPSAMNIIEGSPSRRRSFIDGMLSRIDMQYRKCLRNYENGLRKRNKIIEVERDQAKLREALHFWDTYVIENGSYISEKRAWFQEYANNHPSMIDHTFTLEYLQNQITKETLEASFEKQYYQRRTLVGPQRDDFRICKKANNGTYMDVHTYSSRGEQRLALLWLILHQINIYVDHLEHRPILLLDDILSELDEGNKIIIYKLIEDFQTILTSAEDIPEHIIKPGKVIHV